MSCDRLASSSTASPIFFCGKTALQIARAARAKRVELPRACVPELPRQAPLKREILAAIDAIEAKFAGLLLERPVQVLVGGHARCRSGEQAQSHSCMTALAGDSFFDLGEGVYASIPALVYVRRAAEGATDAELLELGFELCGTYCTEATCSGSGFDRLPLANVEDLRDYASRNSSMKGARSVMRLASFLADGSASPRETKMALLFGLPHRMGGGGLGIPRMNYEVRATKAASLIAAKASFRCDLCWPDVKLDVEYQSRAIHSNEASRIDDSRRANALRAMGWEVVPVTNDELDSDIACEVIVRSLGKLLDKDGRARTKDARRRRLDLRLALGLPVESWDLSE